MNIIALYKAERRLWPGGGWPLVPAGSNRTRKTASPRARGDLDWTVRKFYSPKGLSSTETVCPGNWWNQHPWRYLKGM